MFLTKQISKFNNEYLYINDQISFETCTLLVRMYNVLYILTVCNELIIISREPQIGMYSSYYSLQLLYQRVSQEVDAPHREYINRKKENALFTPM